MFSPFNHRKNHPVQVWDVFNCQSHIRTISRLEGDIKQINAITERELFDVKKTIALEKREEKLTEKEENQETSILNAFPIEINPASTPKRSQSIHSKKGVAKNEAITYKITSDEQSLIQLPPNYETDDLDLKKVVDLLNESLNKDTYTEIVKDDICQIYRKELPDSGSFLVKSINFIPYPRDVIFEAITNIDIRKKWDEGLDELRLAGTNESNGADVLYVIIKSPSILITDRDFVQQRKIWENFPNEHSCLLHFKSIDYAPYPVTPKYIRAETIICGYYLQDNANKPGHTIFGIISQSDIKGNIPLWILHKVSPKALKSWIMNLIKGCKMVLSSRNKSR